jgi:DNA mismatch endonuclease (patch repair protein)
MAIFVDGCFWHGCPVHYKRPSTNQTFWDGKPGRNRARDERVDESLIADGWTVMRFWEHEILANASHCVEEILQMLQALEELDAGEL